MNIDNLFDNLSDNTDTKEEAYYFISEKGKIYNTLVTLAVNKDNGKIYRYSCEWLYLLKQSYPKAPFFKTLVNSYIDSTKKQSNNKYKNKKIIPFITSFSRGTTHGYSGLYFMLDNYIRNKDLYKNHLIAVYKHSQKGIIDIITHLVDKEIINKNKIIYLDEEIKYLFKSITLLPNKWHEMYSILNDKNNYHNVYDNIIVKYLVNNKYKMNYKSVCLIKNFENKNSIKDIDVKNFTNVNKLYNIDVNKIDEIEMINIIYNSEIFVCSWGTSFFKNFFYISEKCKKIIVIITGNYKDQFVRMGLKNILKNYKNAKIYYCYIDNLKDIFLLDISKVNFFSFNFDWQSYVNRNVDLQKAGINNEKKALHHYIVSGINEGRKAD